MKCISNTEKKELERLARILAKSAKEKASDSNAGIYAMGIAEGYRRSAILIRRAIRGKK